MKQIIQKTFILFLQELYDTRYISIFHKYLLSKKLRDRIKNRNAFDKNRMLLIKITVSLEELNDIIWYYHCRKIFTQICMKLEVVC